MEVYDSVIKIVSPKRVKLKKAEQELARQMDRLSNKHHQLQRITDKLQGLNDDFAAEADWRIRRRTGVVEEYS